jgi:hypothetical protein
MNSGTISRPSLHETVTAFSMSLSSLPTELLPYLEVYTIKERSQRTPTNQSPILPNL